MQFTLAAVAGFAALAFASPAPQGVTQNISPPQSAPPGCMTDYPGSFSITTINATTAHKHKRQMSNLMISLKGGKLMDQDGDTGYIAENFQFQFDKPPQTGAIFTSGFSVCPNNSLALGGSAVFYSCNSGAFNNLYDRHWAAQCSPIYIEAIPSGGGVSTPMASATQSPDGQPAQSSALASAPGSSVATQISDKQIQAQTTAASGITQISDKQIQAQTTAPSSAISQISDKQIQAGTSAVSQISDKQIQAGTSAVSQISDKQIQAATSAPMTSAVSQISDKQIQAATSAPSATPVSQINDKQPQAATTAAAGLSQIGDGQIQATSAARNATASMTMYTGGAAIATAAPMAMAAGALFAALL